jgi:ligand-binding sensor domain-containing protein/signal transduction histidine kinase
LKDFVAGKGCRLQTVLYASGVSFKVMPILIRTIYISLFVCCAILLISAGHIRGADETLAETVGIMRLWHSADGLPSESVTAIIQTHDGFLWVGTSAGLVRFDGVKFTELQLTASSTNKLIFVTALCEDSRGSLWIGTQHNGLFQLAEGKLRHYVAQDGLPDDNVTSLAADNHDQVWIGSKSGLNLWTGHGFKSYTTRDGLPDELVSGVNVARSGTVWITTRAGMCRFIDRHITPYLFRTESQGRSPEYLGAYEDRQGNLWAFGDTYLINLAEGKRFNYFRSSESASVRIWSLCEGRDGRLWIGTSGRGLFCFENNRFQPVVFGEDRWPYDVRAICEDHEGNLWLGTSGGGLVQLRPQSVHVLRAGQGLPASPPAAIALDADGRIYVGLQRGGLFMGESGRFDRVGGNNGLTVQNFVTSVCIDQDGTVWVGTLGDGLYGLLNGRGIHLTTADGLADNSVLAVCAEAEGGVWISTSAGALQRLTRQKAIRFDASQYLPGTLVTTLVSASGGGHWLGTQDGRILREQNRKIMEVQMPKDAGTQPVLALYQNEQGWLWIGTDGGGLSCLTDKMALNWTTGNGLPNNIVASVVEDEAKNVWLGTGAGIYRITHGDLLKTLADPQIPIICKLMSVAKTVPESTAVFGGARVVLARDGELWFATSEGVLNVDTHQSEIVPSVFPVCLESVAFNGQPPVSLLQGGLWSASTDTNPVPFRAPVDLRSLEIHFTALSFAPPGQIRFRHRLEGFDSEWVDDAVVRSARYGRLPNGHYRFRVAARNAGGDWQEAVPFEFFVPAHIYVQSWAILLYVLTTIALVAGIVRMVSHRRLRSTLARLEQQQLLERERMRIARDMHDEMGSKLTKISFLSEHAQVGAETTGPLGNKLESIAQTSRELLKTMDEIVWVVNPRNDTLENLVTYLSHYAIEYFQNTNVECELRLPQEFPHHPLSSETRHNLFLTFEEALNNVLKHSAAKKIRVEMTANELEFELKVADNGKGFEISVSSEANIPSRGGGGGNGLKNMRQRLVTIGGECLINSRPGAGTMVALRIPLAKKTGL